MSHSHLIDSLELQFNFDNLEQGESFQSQAVNFTKSRLLTIVDSVFDSFSHIDEVIQIDTLDIDLGEIRDNDFLSQLEKKLEQQLTKQLIQQLNTLQSTASKTPLSKKLLSRERSVSKMTEQQSRLSKLLAYLHSGILPWNAQSSLSSSVSQGWLDTEITCHLNSIVAQLNSGNRQASKIAARLFHQLSPNLLMELISSLSPQGQWLFFPLLSNIVNNKSHKDLAEFYNHPSLKTTKVSWWEQQIADGLQALPSPILFTQWTQIITQHASLFVRGIRRHGQHTDARHIMVNTFSPAQLHDVLMLLEPTEYLFINELLNGTQKGSIEQKQQEAHIKKADDNVEMSPHYLWLFTFDYLLVERGSVFNRKSYLLSVIKKMAAHHNTNEINLLNTITLALASRSKASLLAQQMLTLIQDIRASVDNKPRVQSQNIDAQAQQALKIKHQLIQLFNGGDRDEIVPLWSEVIKNHHEELLQLFSHLGQKSDVLRHLANQLSDEMLFDIVMLVAPTAHQFIAQLIPHSSMILSSVTFKRSEINTQKPAQKNKALLWEFTLSYLVIEHGSYFNRSRYLASLIKQMANRHNLEYKILLQTLYTTISGVENSNELQPLQQLLLSLAEQEFLIQSHKSDVPMAAELTTEMSQLSLEAQNAVKLITNKQLQGSNSTHPWLTQFVVALKKADNTTLAIFWQALIQSQPQLLHELLSLYGKSAKVRHDWVSELHNSTLIDIVTLLAPQQSQTIINVINNTALFQRILTRTCAKNIKDKVVNVASMSQPQKVKRNLWQFSLHYLFVERGSTFNKKSYLSSVLRQLAAHHNLDYQAMLKSMLMVVVAQKNSSSDQMITLLTQIGKEESVQVKVTATSSMVNNFSGYQQLSVCLGLIAPLKQPITLSPINSVFTRLKNNHSLLLQRLLQQALTSNAPWLRLTNQLAQHNLVYLLQQLLTLTYCEALLPNRHINSASQALLLLQERLKALTTLTQQQYFIARLIDELVVGKSIDLERLYRAANNIKQLTPKQLAPLPHVTEGSVKVEKHHTEQPIELTTSPQEAIQRYLRQLTTHPAAITPLLIKQFITAVEQMLVDNSRALTQFIERFIQSPRLSERLLTHLPESLLIKLLWTIQSSRYQAVEAYAELLTQLANAFMLKNKISLALNKSMLYHQYHFVFQYIMGSHKHKNTHDFINDYGHYLTQLLDDRFIEQAANMLIDDNMNAPAPLKTKVVNTIMPQHNAKLAQENITIVAPQSTSESISTTTSFEDKKVEDEKSWLFSTDDDDKKHHDLMTINNAGLVLAAPYIPRLFTMLALTEKGEFKTIEHAYKAVHLLQFMVNNATQTPEYELALNKILCGMPLSEPVPFEVELSDHEKETTSSLLGAIVAHWHALGGTSTQGLQQTFFQREGGVWREEDKWQLNVQTATFDMLLDQLPWSYSLIKYPWMKQPLHVQWR